MNNTDCAAVKDFFALYLYGELSFLRAFLLLILLPELVKIRS